VQEKKKSIELKRALRGVVRQMGGTKERRVVPQGDSRFKPRTSEKGKRKTPGDTPKSNMPGDPREMNHLEATLPPKGENSRGSAGVAPS